MHEDIVRTRAFAMPLTSPAYPIGPYRFRNREYLIITYRTDPQKLRELVPEPLQIDEPSGEVRVHPHAGLDRLRRLHRERTGHSRSRSAAARAATPTACFSMTTRPLPAGASCGAFPRSLRAPRCAPRSIPWSARSITVRCASRPPRWATSTGPPISQPSWPRSRAELPAQDHSACRRHAAHLRARRVSPGGHRPERRLDRSGVPEPLRRTRWRRWRNCRSWRWSRQSTSSPT